jgi:hypothetical protein
LADAFPLRSALSPRDPRWWVQPHRLTAVLFAVVIGGGTLGYVVVEGWSAWEAFYMTVITVTTVGYREVHPMSRAGKVFTVALLIGGVGTVFYTVTLFVARFVESGLSHRWEERRRNRMTDALTGHFIICGFGRIGRIIVEELARQGVPIVVNLRQRFGVMVVSIERPGGSEFNPDPGRRLEAGDKLLVVGPPESLKRLEAEARGTETKRR